MEVLEYEKPLGYFQLLHKSKIWNDKKILNSIDFVISFNGVLQYGTIKSIFSRACRFYINYANYVSCVLLTSFLTICIFKAKASRKLSQPCCFSRKATKFRAANSLRISK